MPTGYTAELMEKGLPFRKFALQCARAFGACIMQRDDPMADEPKPQEPSSYHVKAIAEAKEKLATLRAMTPEQQSAHGAARRQEAIQGALKYHAKGLEENARLDAMTAQVRAWEPPTEEHSTLKSFMLQQIEISRNDLRYSEGRVSEEEAYTPESHFVAAVSGAVRDVAYHEGEHRKELERTGERNKWIDDLYASLPSDASQR